jgi:predicted nucleic acid-binding protein
MTPDSSVLIAGFIPAHASHRQALGALREVRDRGRLVAHTLAETYAVLTAPGGPAAAPGETVLAYLSQFLEREAIVLEAPVYLETLTRLSRAGLAGGAVYDALIAAAAREAGARLVSLDRRAARAYLACAVEAELLV